MDGAVTGVAELTGAAAANGPPVMAVGAAVCAAACAGAPALVAAALLIGAGVVAIGFCAGTCVDAVAGFATGSTVKLRKLRVRGDLSCSTICSAVGVVCAHSKGVSPITLIQKNAFNFKNMGITLSYLSHYSGH
jgi:hypothetical protein